MENKREMDFNDLVSEASNCNLCPRMCGRKKVLLDKNGNINAKVMFIAEAPGRLGAERTGIPLCGDDTGKNFQELIQSIGWKREDMFITNAVLCNPQNSKKNNGTPTKREIKNCSSYLKKTIELVNPKVIVTLGKTALDALHNIRVHNVIFGQSMAQKASWNNRILFPLYHPGNQAKKYRKKERQMADFAALKCMVDPVTRFTQPLNFF
jgi:uracil-DNA glycosylase family 4